MTVGTAGIGWCLCGVGAAAATVAALVVPASPVAVPAPDPPARPSAAADPRAAEAPRFDVVRVGRGGGLVAAGRAMPGAEVALADATPGAPPRALGRARADRRGEWVILPPGPLEPGERVLRLRAEGPGDAAGEASLAVAVPLRPSPEVPAATVVPASPVAVAAALGPSAAPPAPPGHALVRPGASLWRIAEEAYGRGPLYPRIHRANRDQVRDAHRIHPGQVLVLP